MGYDFLGIGNIRAGVRIALPLYDRAGQKSPPGIFTSRLRSKARIVIGMMFNSAACFSLFFFILCLFSQPVFAQDMAAHRALYEINMVATHAGSSVQNISGKMFYETRPGCEAWTNKHRFSLFYEYGDSPGLHIETDFSTFEHFDGTSFNFTSRRKRDGELYQELRGVVERATVDEESAAQFSLPEDLHFTLKPKTYFPMQHTAETIVRAQEGEKFFSAQVFDGSDEEGPVEINTIILGADDPRHSIKMNNAIDATLIDTDAWQVRMAVFPLLNQEPQADYEMTMILHDNGVISDMLINYDDFSITQKLVAIEELEAQCAGDEGR